MNVKTFLWGTFQFGISGFNLQYSSQNLQKNEISDIFQRFNENIWKNIAQSATNKHEGEIIALLGKQLPYGRAIVMIAYASGQDDRGRKGGYGVYGIISENSVSLSEFTKKVLENKKLFVITKKEHYENLLKGKTDNILYFSSYIDYLKIIENNKKDFAIIDGENYNTLTKITVEKPCVCVPGNKETKKPRWIVSLIIIVLLLCGCGLVYKCTQPTSEFEIITHKQNKLKEGDSWIKNANAEIKNIAAEWKISSNEIHTKNPAKNFRNLLMELKTKELKTKEPQTSNITYDDFIFIKNYTEKINNATYGINKITPPEKCDQKTQLKYFKDIYEIILGDKPSSERIASVLTDLQTGLKNKMSGKSLTYLLDKTKDEKQKENIKEYQKFQNRLLGIKTE